MVKKRRKRSQRKLPSECVARIHCTGNNTIVTITTKKGNTLLWTSAGTFGFKGAKKRTPYGSQGEAKLEARRAYKRGVRKIIIFMITRLLTKFFVFGLIWDLKIF